MKLHLRYFAVLSDEAGCTDEELESRAASLAELYEELRIRHGFRLPRKSVRVAMHDEFCSWEQAPRQGAVIAFIPPVSGG